MYTRQSFDRQRALKKQIERREMRLLAVVSVGLGVAQLLFIRWMDTQLPHNPRVAIEGAVFLAYMALVCWLIWRLQVRLRAACVTCPQCSVRLQDMSERVAAATGRCDSCGGQVLEG